MFAITYWGKLGIEMKTRSLTMSVSARYKKSPAVTAKIHCLTTSSAATDKPTYRPTNAVKADKKLSNNAFLTVMPAFSKMAKSPGMLKVGKTFNQFRIKCTKC